MSKSILGPNTQTLTEWCEWLRNDLTYRAPELWPDAIVAWLDNTVERFGERTSDEVPTAAREFVEAVDTARELGLAPTLGPVLVQFQRLRAATGVGPFLGDDPASPSSLPGGEEK